MSSAAVKSMLSTLMALPWMVSFSSSSESLIESNFFVWLMVACLKYRSRLAYLLFLKASYSASAFLSAADSFFSLGSPFLSDLVVPYFSNFDIRLSYGILRNSIKIYL